MGCLWTRSAGLIALATLIQKTQADFDGLHAMHRVERAHEIMHHHRREVSCIFEGWSLCPATVGGGCCPNGYSCNTDSCSIATDSPSSACGKANYYNCPREKGAGCCPLGSICGNNQDCYSPEGLPISISCPANHYACPSTIGGCCQNGMGCAKGYCYETSAATEPVSSIVTTTNSHGDTITTVTTETTVITPGPGPGTAEANTSPIVVPSVVTKLPSVGTADSSSGGGGLTKSQLGGIIAGVVIVVVVVVVATFIIIRRLKQTERAVAATESKRDTSDGHQRSHKPSFGQPTISEVEGPDVDPLMQSPNFRPSHIRSGSDESFTERSHSRTPNIPSTASTPPAWSSEFNNLGQIAEAPAPSREHSLDSSRGGGVAYENGRWSQVISCDSRLAHSRNHSDASELDAEATNRPGKAELYGDSGNSAAAATAAAVAADQASRRRASTSAAHARKNSGGGARGRSESAGATVPLSTVNEFGELHGHYGPSDLAVGQTADRLARHDSTTSSIASRAAMEAAARKMKGESSVTSTPTDVYRKFG